MRKKTSKSSKVPACVLVLIALVLFESRRLLPVDGKWDAIEHATAHWQSRAKQLAPFVADCGGEMYECPAHSMENKQPTRRFELLGPSDAVMVVDHLNNWHWCPSALIRQRSLDESLFEFLSVARSKGALIVHAVSDSKNHYLLDPLVQPFVKRETDAGVLHIPKGLAQEWTWVDKPRLNELGPPVSLSLDKVCGEKGANLFGDKNRKPKWLPGLNASRLVAGDIVATEQDAIYTEIINHVPKVRRIFFVGVHLQLCILYSRWFSILRMAKAWNFDNVEFGIVVSLTDVSNTNPSEDYNLQTKIDWKLVKQTSCWIRCKVAPAILGGKVDQYIRLYNYA